MATPGAASTIRAPAAESAAFPALPAGFHYNARDFSDFRPSAPF